MEKYYNYCDPIYVSDHTALSDIKIILFYLPFPTLPSLCLK